MAVSPLRTRARGTLQRQDVWDVEYWKPPCSADIQGDLSSSERYQWTWEAKPITPPLASFFKLFLLFATFGRILEMHGGFDFVAN